MAASFTPVFLLAQSLPGTELESMQRVEAVIVDTKIAVRDGEAE